MPFDPSKPAENSALSSPEMRAQLTGLKALIDAIAQISAAQVDGVNTLNPGDPADVTLSVNGNTLHFTFSIPRGADGAPGTNGSNGLDGNDGGPGPPGPSVAGSVVDAVNTLNPGDNATVLSTFDGSNVHFTFGIPRGADGTPGSNGANGNDGQNGINGNDGAQGPSGEVTNSDLASAISGTSANTNAVNFLGITVSDPPTQGEMQQIANRLDELINALRR